MKKAEQTPRPVKETYASGGVGDASSEARHLAPSQNQRLRPGSSAEKQILLISFVLAVLTLLADQGSKLWIERCFIEHESRPVIPDLLSITSVRNYGAAWSILSGHGWLLLLIAAAVTFCAIRYFHKLAEGCTERYIAIFLVLGGIVGNSIDRLWRGAVVDFIDVHYQRVWNYPVFNIADIAICIGVGLFILSSLLRKSVNTAETSGEHAR